MPTIVHDTIMIDAPPESIWQALTNPEITRKYFFHARVHSDWRKNSSIIFEGRMFWIIPYRMEGEIIDIEPGRMLKYTLRNGKGNIASTSTITIMLEPVNSTTVVRVTDDVGNGPGGNTRYARSVKGWKKILQGLKKTVEA